MSSLKNHNADARFRPVFIGGADRSGTTVLGDLLGSHADCLCTPESQFIVEASRRFRRKLRVPLESIPLQALGDFLQQSQRLKIWGVTLDTNSVPGSETGAFFPEIIYRLLRSYGETHDRPSFKFWVDHTPNHIRYTNFLLNLFPQAKVIHLIRDGRAVANSIIPLDFGPNTISDSAIWWTRCVAHGLAAESFWGKSRVLRVYYEELLSDPEDQLKTICGFVGVEYTSKMIGGGRFLRSYLQQGTALSRRQTTRCLAGDCLEKISQHA